jgi:hypothetical protein
VVFKKQTKIRLRIRILLFLVVAFKIPTKISFSNFFCLFLTVGTLTSVFKDNMSLSRHKTVEIMVYLNFFASLPVDGRIRISKNNYMGSGSWRPKNIGSGKLILRVADSGRLNLDLTVGML